VCMRVFEVHVKRGWISDASPGHTILTLAKEFGWKEASAIICHKCLLGWICDIPRWDCVPLFRPSIKTAIFLVLERIKKIILKVNLDLSWRGKIEMPFSNLID